MPPDPTSPAMLAPYLLTSVAMLIIAMGGWQRIAFALLMLPVSAYVYAIDQSGLHVVAVVSALSLIWWAVGLRRVNHGPPEWASRVHELRAVVDSMDDESREAWLRGEG